MIVGSRKSGVTVNRAIIWITKIKVKIAVNAMRRFFAETFDGLELIIEATRIVESEGPKAAIKSIQSTTGLSLPPMIGARSHIVQEIRKAKMKKQIVGLLLIFCLSVDCTVNTPKLLLHS
jgi:hypothetical protein